MAIEHILIAHDLRDTADLALRRAAQLAQQHRARLTLLHVLDQHLSAAAREQVERSLDHCLTQYAPAGSELLLLSGRAADAVLSQIKQLQGDLLVLGAHHQRHDFFSDTTLERIAQGCQIPLLLVSRDDAQPYQRALAALNFSLCACNAFGHAARLLPASAELYALHVFEAGKGPASEHESQRLTQCALIEQLLRDETQHLPASRPQITHTVHAGSMPQTLYAMIDTYQPQLLVLGWHCRNALTQVLANWVQQCLSKPPCDVLIAR